MKQLAPELQKSGGYVFGLSRGTEILQTIMMQARPRMLLLQCYSVEVLRMPWTTRLPLHGI